MKVNMYIYLIHRRHLSLFVLCIQKMIVRSIVNVSDNTFIQEKNVSTLRVSMLGIVLGIYLYMQILRKKTYHFMDIVFTRSILFFKTMQYAKGFMFNIIITLFFGFF